MSEWQEVTLKDVVTILGDGIHGTPKYDDNGEYFFINGNNLRDGKIVVDDRTRRAPAEEYKKHKKDLNDRTILVSINGTLGNVALYDGEKCFLGKSACYFNVKDDVDKLFIKYLVTNWHFQIYIDSFANGTTIKNVSLKTMREYPFSLPPLPEQKAIAAVLSSLDDKIDLLQRQNQTLEALAQTLFRQWFVEEAEDDWKDGTLGDIAENIRDSVRHDKVSNGTIYIGLEHIDKVNIALSRNGLSDDVKSNKYQFLEEDILFGKLRPYFHKVCFAPFSGICSTDILVLRPKKLHYFCFCLFAFFQKDVVDYANLGSGGTRMPRTNWKVLKEYPIALPPDNILELFNNLIYPSIEKIKHNLTQIRTLEKLRDTLLPKLMSGEASVRY